MTCRRPDRDALGLTLIELVLTLTIMAVAGGIIAAAFAAGLHGWQVGSRRGREDLVARIVLERIAMQLRAAVAAPGRRAGEDAVAFEAGDHELRFVTVAAGPVPMQVAYAMDGDGGRFVYREYPWPDKEFFGEHRPVREEQVPEVAGFSVKVTKRVDDKDAEDPAAVTAEWTPLDGELPARVSIEISMVPEGDREPARHQITVPIPTLGVP